MYDMYEYNRPEARAPEQEVTRPARRVRPRRPAADALQVALDRRDNGGDASPSRDQ
ncbi:MAG TPA: hypothetical protein VGS19_23470 [Streptosporangiaceae bacterium]|nr:hypothetical protein [Streptosporangiaceae bacterium]